MILTMHLEAFGDVLVHTLESCFTLSELSDVDPKEMEDDSNDWMDAVDRGGLQHTSDMLYMVFFNAETELQQHLPQHGTATFNITQFKPLLVESEDVTV